MSNRSLFLKLLKLSCFALLTIILGCLPNYRVDYEIKAAELVGSWSLDSTSGSVGIDVGTTYTNAQLILSDDGGGQMKNFPILESSKQTSLQKWRAFTEPCRWELKDRGNGGKHIWMLELVNSEYGIEVYATKTRAGAYVLDYMPDPDRGEQFLFRKKRAKEN